MKTIFIIDGIIQQFFARINRTSEVAAQSLFQNIGKLMNDYKIVIAPPQICKKFPAAPLLCIGRQKINLALSIIYCYPVGFAFFFFSIIGLINGLNDDAPLHLVKLRCS